MEEGDETSKSNAPAEEAPNSTPLYPPAASAFVDNEAGGARRKPRIQRIHKCQDVVFLVAFLVCGVGFIVGTGFGFHRGNPLRLVHGLDYKGNACGDKKAMPSLKGLGVLYWVNPAQLFHSGLRTDQFGLSNARSICLNNCPKLANGTIAWVCEYPEGSMSNVSMANWRKRNYNYFDLLRPDQQESSMNFMGPCYPVLFQSTNVFWRCQLEPFPDNQTMQLWKSLNGSDVPSGVPIVRAVDRALTSPSATFQRYIADLGRAWPVLLLFGGLVPFLFSVSWLILICYFARSTIWLTLALLNILALLITLCFYNKVGWIGNDAVTAVIGAKASSAILASSTEQSHLKVVAVFITLILILTVLVSVALLQRISVAIAVIKVAMRAIISIPSLLIYPLLPFLILAVFLIYWVAATLYLFSAGKVGDIETECCGFKFHHTKNIVWAILYHFFSLYWVTQFIFASSVTTVAGALASCYWARGETALWNGGEGTTWKGMGWFPVVSAAKQVTHYSLGSMALGSLIVPPIEMTQFVLQSLRKKLKSAEITMPNGTVVSTHGRYGTCCLGCLDSTLTYINKNAYIVVAISGKEFCGAAEKATMLIINNTSKVGSVMAIGDLVLFLSKLCVSFASSLFAFLMLDTHHYKTSASRVSSPLFPLLFCWGCAYVTASIFFGVAEMAVDTILLSFCMDSEEHIGTALFAPPSLIEILNRFVEQQEAAEAARNFKKMDRYDTESNDNDDRDENEESSN